MNNVTQLPPFAELANARLDYLNFDRLGIKEVHKRLSNGETDLHRWLADTTLKQQNPVDRR
jgi:hypothetical protein